MPGNASFSMDRLLRDTQRQRNAIEFISNGSRELHKQTALLNGGYFNELNLATNNNENDNDNANENGYEIETTDDPFRAAYIKVYSSYLP
jgi:hypothetical protein